MPTYQYICLDCDEQFEEKRPFAQASAPASCPTCAGEHTKKLLSAVAFNLGKSAIPVPMSTAAQDYWGGGTYTCQY